MEEGGDGGGGGGDVEDSPQVQGDEVGDVTDSTSASPGSAASRDKSKCGLCDKRPNRPRRSDLYCHYSTAHFSESLKQFINVEKKSCNICGKKIRDMFQLLNHVGVVHGKVEQFLDPAFHIPKRQKIYDQKHYKCNICQKGSSSRKNLKMHIAVRHCKEEFKQFIDEKQLLCNICQYKSNYIWNLRIHVGTVHNKVDEVMQQTIESPQQTGNKQLDQDLDLSSDEDLEEAEISQGDIERDKEEMKTAKKKFRL